jgi:hypothetical protein
MTICKFCGQPAKLVRAHIIPRGLYGEFQDENGAVTKLISSEAENHPKRIPIGIYDPDLVCASCESQFSPWDDYAVSFFRDTEPEALLSSAGEVIGYKYPTANYTNLKLFFMSLLWRAHATHNAFFNRVNLGPWASDLQHRIAAKDPGHPRDYSVLIAKYDDPLSGAMFEPLRLNVQGVNYYRFYLPHHRIYIKVDKRPFPTLFERFMAKPDEPFYVFIKDYSADGERQLMLNIVARNMAKMT